ncbi:hypothetical protein ACLQ25_09525 [Micromonospora sp. DT44]|uniref:hypothetical protein n=1 Tax=Micromonospora sp. DT44 TaxID=3393439 RepID=UPI003CED21DD
MSQVRKYKVTQNGFETVMKLNDEDAKAYPDAQLLDEPAEQPEPADADEKPAAKTRTPADKSRRSTSDK